MEALEVAIDAYRAATQSRRDAAYVSATAAGESDAGCWRNRPEDATPARPGAIQNRKLIPESTK